MTTSAQFAADLMGRGAQVRIDGHDVIARHRGVEITAHFYDDADTFDAAWRSDVPAGTANKIRSMTAAVLTLGLPEFRDRFGKRLAVGDRVFKMTIDDGAPLWAGHGTVVGFGRTRVKVEWDGYGYDHEPPAPPHRPHPMVLRRMTR